MELGFFVRIKNVIILRICDMDLKDRDWIMNFEFEEERESNGNDEIDGDNEGLCIDEFIVIEVV